MLRVRTPRGAPEPARIFSGTGLPLARSLPRLSRTNRHRSNPTSLKWSRSIRSKGGPLGGLGHEAGEDFTLPFRERLISCSMRPVGIGANDKVIIRVHMAFNQDGSLSSRPRLLVPAPSAKQRALTVKAWSTRWKSCQPFTMLPPDKYQLWKTLVWYIGFPVTAFIQ